ncbi:MAG: hypothetical protein KDK36_14420, partial [Leptospiraceae bacterium]|nr:hypothetical protein [Leptospiraceae bacterium]
LNYFNYSHFLGPRFFGNYSGEFSISGKLTQMVTMIFSTVNNGVPSLGIFFISPFLFVPIIHSILNKDNYPNHILVFVYSTITFLLVASFIAPNNGITIAGRYLTAACFPMIIILEEFSQKSISKSLKITQRVLIAWAMIITLVSLATLAFSFKQVKRFEKQFASLDTDIWFFSTGFLSGSISLKYLDKKVMNINEKNVPKFESILKNNSINKFSILAPSVEFKKNLKLEEPSEQMLKVAKETNYNCKEISKSKELLRFDCERE